jgi:hypothetical protein
VARFFHMRIGFAAVVPMVGRDTYVGGKGMGREGRFPDTQKSRNP